MSFRTGESSDTAHAHTKSHPHFCKYSYFNWTFYKSCNTKRMDLHFQRFHALLRTFSAVMKCHREEFQSRHLVEKAVTVISRTCTDPGALRPSNDFRKTEERSQVSCTPTPYKQNLSENSHRKMLKIARDESVWALNTIWLTADLWKQICYYLAF